MPLTCDSGRILRTTRTLEHPSDKLGRPVSIDLFASVRRPTKLISTRVHIYPLSLAHTGTDTAGRRPDPADAVGGQHGPGPVMRVRTITRGRGTGLGATRAGAAACLTRLHVVSSGAAHRKAPRAACALPRQRGTSAAAPAQPTPFDRSCGAAPSHAPQVRYGSSRPWPPGAVRTMDGRRWTTTRSHRLHARGPAKTLTSSAILRQLRTTVRKLMNVRSTRSVCRPDKAR